MSYNWFRQIGCIIMNGSEEMNCRRSLDRAATDGSLELFNNEVVNAVIQHVKNDINMKCDPLYATETRDIWTDITKEEPNSEVLATDGKGEFLVGYISQDVIYQSRISGPESGSCLTYSCESNDTILNNVTHWCHTKDLFNNS